MADLTRLKKFAEKKTYSVAAARVTHDMVADTALQELFELPADCLIVDACVDVKTAGQALLTVDFGFDGGAELGNDLDIDGAGVVSVALSGGVKAPRIDTGTGKTVTAKFSADPTAGDFVFIVEYIEYELGNGKLTNYA